MNVTLKVPTNRASAPKLGSLPGAGFGIQRGLVKKCTQLSFGTIGAASLKMNKKIAAMPMMLLQPQRRISHSVGFSIESNKLNVFRPRPAAGGGPAAPAGFPRASPEERVRAASVDKAGLL